MIFYFSWHRICLHLNNIGYGGYVQTENLSLYTLKSFFLIIILKQNIQQHEHIINNY